METRLVVQYVPPSVNRTRGQHWAAAKKRRDDAVFPVAKAVAGADWPKAAGRAATISFALHQHGKPRDADNLVASCKGVIDELVRREVLVDDSLRYLRIGSVTHQKAPPKKGFLELTITYTPLDE